MKKKNFVPFHLVPNNKIAKYRTEWLVLSFTGIRQFAENAQVTI